MKKLTTTEFINRSNTIHKNRFDYSLVDYVNNTTKISIICKLHGIFEQTPKEHLKGGSCKVCSGKSQKTTEQFIRESNEIHGYKYDYSKTVYINNWSKVIIICPIHGEFEQVTYSHSNGIGCMKCAAELNGKRKRNPNKIIRKSIDELSKTTQQFIDEANKVHENLYDYSKTKYINNKTKVTIICKLHGIFLQNPLHHIRGIGCPTCKQSKGAKHIRTYLEFYGINFISEFKFHDCCNVKPLPFDFYLPNHNICIEYDGKQHFEIINRSKDLTKNIESFEKIKYNDNIKTSYCKNNRITLIRIPYWDDISEVLSSYLLTV